jgi:hypothetical protein
MANERSGAAKVVSQEGSRLQVEHKGQRLTVPMRGFPEGFTLKPGALVILLDEPTGTVARPLVRVTHARAPRENVQKRGTLDVDGRRVEMQPSTIVEAAPHGEPGGADEYEVWIVDGVEQVIAARRRGR